MDRRIAAAAVFAVLGLCASTVSAAPFTGRVSQTIVALPVTNLQSGKYLVSVQNQTARQQFIDACTQLGR